MSVSSKKKVLINEIAVQKLLNLIKDENLQPGDKLPPERTLSQQLGISRNSLREALNNLKATGVVRIRQGSGIYVDVTDGFTHKDSQGVHDISASISQILDARFMIEPHCVRQVAKYITLEQIKQLRDLESQEYQDNFCNAGRNEVSKFPRTNLEGLIISFLKNPIISDIHYQLSTSWKNSLDEIGAVVLEPEVRHKHHLELIKALEEQKPDKAEKAMIHHLNKSKECIYLFLEQHNKTIS